MIKSLLYDRLRVLSPYWLRRWFKNRSWFTPVSRRLFGTDVYSRSYFRDVERLENASVEHIADWIVLALGPARAIDVGCGPGHLMAALKRRGVDPFGVDVSAAAIEATRAKGLSVERFDLTQRQAPLPGAPFDLAISCEVAEHLEERHAEAFVDKLVAAAPRVFLTAAEPDAGAGPGLHHVNEQPHAYWTAKMASRGYRLDDAATSDARRHLDRPDVINYLRRPMIFTGVRTSSHGK